MLRTVRGDSASSSFLEPWHSGHCSFDAGQAGSENRPRNAPHTDTLQIPTSHDSSVAPTTPPDGYRPWRHPAHCVQHRNRRAKTCAEHGIFAWRVTNFLTPV